MLPQKLLRSFGNIVARIRQEISGEPASTEEPPPEIPGYTVVERIGEGGMGTVYLADDRVLGRRDAIKVIGGLGPRNDETRRLFLREAKAMASVAHPNVVRIYSYGETSEGPYIAMEYIDGESLAHRLREAGFLAANEALDILRQTIDGLEAAWEKGIIHRDIKPSNLLLDGKGQVRVCDFGLARPVPTDVSTASTDSGLIAGTPHYMSPEQAKGRPTDLRSDIYSLGIVLYEVLAGDLPVGGESLTAVLDRHFKGPLDALSGVRRELVDLYEWMTRRDPAERPPSYAELRDRVDKIRGRLGRSRPFWLLGVTTWIDVTSRAAVALMLLSSTILLADPWRGRLLPALTVEAFVDEPVGPGDPPPAALGEELALSLLRTLVGRINGFVVVVADQNLGPFAVDSTVGGRVRRSGNDVLVDLEVRQTRDRRIVGEQRTMGNTGAKPDLGMSLAQASLELLRADSVRVPIAPQTIPVNLRRDFELLETAIDEEQVDEVITRLEIAIENDPHQAEAHAYLGRANLKKREITRDSIFVYDAGEHCQRAVELDDGLAAARVCRGWVNIYLNELTLAFGDFVAAVERGATVEGYLGLGRVYYKANRFDVAEAYLLGATDREPNCARCFMALAWLYGRTGEYGAAADWYLRAAERAYPRALLSLGGMYYWLGLYEEAIDAFDRSNEHWPTSDAYSNLGLAYLLQGRYSDAIAALTEATRLAQTDYRHYGNLARAYALIGDHDAAVDNFRVARRYADADINFDEESLALLILPYYSLKLGEPDRARVDLDHALDALPEENEAYYWAAIVQLELGLRDDACKSIEQALERGYSRAEIRDTPEFERFDNCGTYQQLIARNEETSPASGR